MLSDKIKMKSRDLRLKNEILPRSSEIGKWIITNDLTESLLKVTYIPKSNKQMDTSLSCTFQNIFCGKNIDFNDSELNEWFNALPTDVVCW